jgi:DNA-binding transcriptional MerR regulator
MQDDRLIDQRAAADLLGVSPSTLNYWRATGRGPAFVRISARCVRYRPQDLSSFAEAHRVVGPEARQLGQM